ncbi:MAG: discoidin domain-containing protein [Clostridia bacterium]|nr:discoidin domain-containing protein [Clostridia bacterium]
MSAKQEKKKRKLYAVSDAHLDTQWNWDIQDTIRDCVKNTLVQNFDLIEKYPGYKFNFEGAFRYKLAKEYYPDMYEKLKEYVAQGRWNVAGSSWDACDVNVPSSEALMRQILLGNGFFEKEFGKKSTDIFLTDCFGFPYSLPSVEAHMGLNGFSTQKLVWGLGQPVIKDGEVLKPFKGENEVRMDVGKWKGPDGNFVYTYLDPGGYGYNFDENDDQSPINSRESFLKMIEKNEEVSGISKKAIYFGTGDYGGSPKESSARMVQEALDDKDGGLYEVIMSTTDQFFNELTPEEKENLPVYDGELLIPHGYGAFSSRTINKRWNRKNELLADSAEKAASMAKLLAGEKYPSENFDFAWKQFLWHQFHDDLPGTSLPRAYAFSHNDYVVSLNMFANELKNSVGAVAKTLKTNVEGIPVVVFNPVSTAVCGPVEAKTDIKADFVRVYDADGNEVPAQIKNGVVKFTANVPSVAFKVYDVRPSDVKCGVETSLSVTESTLENAKFKVTIDENGDIASVYDKILGKELLEKPSRLQITHDESHDWPSWEIDYSSFVAEPNYVGGSPEIEIVDNGPAVVALKITRYYGNSIFVQTVSLFEGAERVDVDCKVEWREIHSLLKVTFPLTAKNENADFDLGLGAITRGNSNSEPYYEYSHHQWADITDKSGEYGVSILNDCKYGIDKPEDGLFRLTLIHTPNWGALRWSTQCFQDFGTNIFKYSICSHEGFRTDIPAQAAAVNQPIIPFITNKHEGKVSEFSLVEQSGKEFIVKAVKKEEKGDRLIVRVQEMTGKGVNGAFLKFGRNIVDAVETNGYETEIGAADAKDNVLTFDLTPYAVKTFALTLVADDNVCGKAKTKTIELPYDKRITSLNDKRTAGDLFNGVSIPEEMYEESIVSGGIPFEMGKKGKMNGMICAGQTVTIPEGTKKLWIVAAANGDREATFELDGKPVKLNIQDFGEHIGKWDMLGGSWDAPIGGKTYLANVKRDDIAAIYTHTHNADGDRLYLFAYLFKYCIDVEGVKTVKFPTDDNIVITAATAALCDNADTTPAALLYDSSETEETYKVTIKTENGEEVQYVGKDKIIMIEAPLKYENGKVFSHWTGDGIFFTDETRALVAIKGDVTLTAETIDFGTDLLENHQCKASILHEGGDNPERIFDGEGNKCWTSKFDENGEVSVEVRINGEKTISKWIVQGSGARLGFSLNLRNYRLEYKMKNEDEWQIADEVKDNTDTLTVREFTPVKARMVRLVITNYEKDEKYLSRVYRFCLA